MYEDMSSSMGGWLSATELTRQNCVGEGRLLEHARRGNLPCRRDGQGQLHYDATLARRLFRPRTQATTIALDQPAGAGFGILGQLTLGGGHPQRRKPAARAARITTSHTVTGGMRKRTSAA